MAICNGATPFATVLLAHMFTSDKLTARSVTGVLLGFCGLVVLVLPEFGHGMGASFFGILLEHHAGKLPAWLAPLHAVVLNISEKQADFARDATEFLKNQGLRAEIDLRNEKVGYKIRDHTLKRVPYLLIAGDREVESRSLAVRTRSGKDLGAMPLEEVAARIARDVASRGLNHLED